MTLNAVTPASVLASPTPRRKSLLARAIAGVVVVGAIGAIAASNACVESEATFFIVSPTSHDVKTGVCKDSPFCPAANVDGFGCFIVESQLIPRARNDTNRVETNLIIISEVDIEVLDSTGAVRDSFTTALSGFVNPKQPEDTTTSLLAFPILRTESLGKFAPGEPITVGIIVKGRTTGGVDVETPEYYTPVTSYGCDKDASSCC